MAVYLTMTAVLILLGVLIEKRKYGKQIYCISAGAIIFIMSAIRYNVGYDYILYQNWYNKFFISDISQIGEMRYEKGFSIPMKILSDVIHNPQIMFVLISLAVSVLLMVYIYKNSKCMYISVAAFITFGFYFNSMNFMRQFIAALIVIYALKYIRSHQLFRYIILVLFASMFHMSALIMIPFYFILLIKFNYITLIAYSAVSVAAFVFSEKILSVVTKYFYSGYSITSDDVAIGLPFGYLLGFALFFAVVFFLRRRLVEKDGLNGILITSMYFACVFEFIGLKHSVVSRFSLIFAIAPVILLLPQVVDVFTEFFKKKSGKAFSKGRVITYIVTGTLCLSFFSYQIYNNYNGVLPYKTVFEEATL